MDPQSADGEELTQDEANKRAARMKRLLDKVLDCPARIDSVKKLTEILDKIVRLEREVFGIDSNKSGEGTFEEMLRRLGQQAR